MTRAIRALLETAADFDAIHGAIDAAESHLCAAVGEDNPERIDEALIELRDAGAKISATIRDLDDFLRANGKAPGG